MTAGSTIPPPEPGYPDQLARDRQLLAVETRQSAIAVVFIAWRSIRNLGTINIGIVAVFLISGRLSGALLGVGVVAVLIGSVFMIIAWWRFVFVIDGDELLVRKGVVAEERLTIPLDRVQSVSINQRFLHRLVGLVSASVDTAGSSAAEFEIDAIDRPTAEALQRLVAGHRRNAPASAEAMSGSGRPGGEDRTEDRVIIKRTLPDLIKIGAGRWPWAGLVALAPLVAILDDLRGLLPDFLDEQDLVSSRLPTEFGSGLVVVAAAIVLTAIVVGALLGTLLQIVSEVVTNWDLTLFRTSTGFRRTAGLLSRTSRASTLNRIQAVQTDQTPVQRLLGIEKLTLPTIGEGDLVLPGSTAQEVDGIRSIVFGPSAAPPPLDRRISPLAIFLAVRNRLLITVPIFVVLFVRFRWWAALILLLVPGQWLVARRRWRLRRWSLSDGRIAESYELINKHTADLELIKTQTVSVSRTFFERRRNLATVRVTTAEGHLAVPLIPVVEAMAVRDLILFSVESDRRSWM